MNQITTFKLQGIRDNTTILAATIEQSASDRNINLPPTASGESVRLLSLDGNGTANIKMRLDRILPVNSVVDLNSITKVKITEANSKKKILMETNTSIKLNLESL